MKHIKLIELYLSGDEYNVFNSSGKKHEKKLKRNIPKYKTNDYVILKDEYAYNFYPCVKIKEVYEYDSSTPDYFVEAYRLTNFIEVRIDSISIKRLAKPKEIEEFELQRYLNKYNL